MSRAPLLATLALTSVLAVIQACTNRDIVGVVVSRVGIQPPVVTVYVGDSVQLTAVVWDDRGEVLQQAQLEWTSGEATVVEVEPNGMVRGLRAGSAEVWASFQDEAASAQIIVAPPPVYDFTVTESSGSTSVTEGGGMDDLSIVLLTQPSSSVVLQAESENEGEVSVNPRTLTFTASNWDVPQVVEVVGEDDNQVDGDQTASVTIIVDVDVSDPSFAGASPKVVDVVNFDDDTPGFAITATDGATSAAEGGASDTLSVVLTVQPTADVRLAVSVDDPTDATVSPTTLTFTSQDWDEPQLVTFGAVDDSVADGTGARSISVAVEAGSDSHFLALPPLETGATTVDNDEGGWTLAHTGEGTVSTEGGVTDSISVTLTAPTASVVVLDVSTEHPEDATVTPEVLTFTEGEATTQWVVFTAVDDPDLDGARAHAVTVWVDPVSDAPFLGLPPQTIDASTVDNDVAGFTVWESGGVTAVDEGGGSDVLVIALTARPTADVTFEVSSGDLTEVLVAPPTVTFTPETWDRPRDVTVTGVDDDLGDGNQVTGITVAPDAASDPDFATLSAWVGTAVTVDDDGVGITVGETEGTIVNESGTLTDAIAVKLNALPVQTVVLTIASADPGEATVSPTLLTFTPENGGDPQAVVVSGVDDPVADGDVVTELSVAVNLGLTLDPAYDTVSARAVFATTLDDDLGSFEVTETDGSTSVSESGTSDELVVSIGAQPLANVILTVQSADLGEAWVDPPSLTFTPDDWDTPKTVTVTGVDDMIVDGSVLTDITIAVDPASDPTFVGLPAQSVPVETHDDETAAFAILESGGETIVTEGGSTDTFTVFPLYRPHKYVTIVASSPDPGEVTVSPPSVTFTRDDWNQPRTFTVTGVDDSIADGDQITLILLSPVSTHDHDVEDVPNQTVTVTTVDDEAEDGP